MRREITNVGPMEPEPRFISAAATATAVERALEFGDEPAAIGHLTEAISRLIQAPEYSKIPLDVLEAPDPIRDSRYETLIATAFAYALSCRGEMPLAWMTDTKPVPTEWLWRGDGASEEYRDFVRDHTPQNFRDKNILTRERDWATRRVASSASSTASSCQT
ncbi:hypothetical protein A20C1_03508 [marine actinobacterium PHSC20C1]|nr:hypothetical protein A20C1_03508 [marine actinobacterium PHSC20C1]